MYVYSQEFPYYTLALALFGVLGAIPFKGGPGYVIANRKLVNLQMKPTDGKIYETRVRDTLYKSDHHKRVSAQPPNVKMVSVPVVDKEKLSQLGLVHEAKTNIDTSYIGGDGWGDAATADDALRVMLDDGFASAMKRVANSVSHPITAALIFMCRPADDSEAVNYLASRWHPNVAADESLERELDPDYVMNPVDKRIHDLTLKRTEEVFQISSQVTMAIAVSMPRPKTWNKKLSELSTEVIARAPVVEATRLLAEDLTRLGVQGVRRFTLFQLNAFLRAVFSVDLQEFYADQAVDIAKERKGELKSLQDSLTLSRGPWASQMFAHNDGLECDTTFHRHFWISNFENSTLPPGFLEELLSIDGLNYTVSLFIETVPQRRDMRRAGTRRRLIQRKAEAKVGDTSNPKYEAEYAEATAQHYGLYESQSAGTRTRLQITVSESDMERSSAAVGLISAVCRSMNMTMEPYLGEVQNVEAAFSSIGIVTDAS
jgi:hypothetical protein